MLVLNHEQDLKDVEKQSFPPALCIAVLMLILSRGICLEECEIPCEQKTRCQLFKRPVFG